MLEASLVVFLSTFIMFLIYRNIKLEKRIVDLEFERFMQLDLDRVRSSQEETETLERTLQ